MIKYVVKYKIMSSNTCHARLYVNITCKNIFLHIKKTFQNIEHSPSSLIGKFWKTWVSYKEKKYIYYLLLITLHTLAIALFYIDLVITLKWFIAFVCVLISTERPIALTHSIWLITSICIICGCVRVILSDKAAR